tara:strand:- start:44 stop:550 length:507 start_codon:yes stop_codon:yes gene_type:complete
MGYKIYSNDFKVEVCNFSNDNTYADTRERFGISKGTINSWRKSLGYPDLGVGYRKSFGENVQIEACQMYMGNPSTTKQEVCDQYGCHVTTLGKWLRIHGFSMKVAKRKPMPTRADRVVRNFKVLKTEHNKVKAELMQLKQAQQDDNHWLKDRLTRIADAIKVRNNMEV